MCEWRWTLSIAGVKRIVQIRAMLRSDFFYKLKGDDIARWATR